MNLKKLALGCAAGFTLLAAAPAFADPRHGAPAHGWRAQQPQYQPNFRAQHRPHYRHYRAPAYVYYQSRPIYVPPPVAYYPPPPVVYYEPRPVIYGTLPIGDARVRIGLQF